MTTPINYIYNTYTLYTQCLRIRDWLLKFSDCSCDEVMLALLALPPAGLSPAASASPFPSSIPPQPPQGHHIVALLPRRIVECRSSRHALHLPRCFPCPHGLPGPLPHAPATASGTFATRIVTVRPRQDHVLGEYMEV